MKYITDYYHTAMKHYEMTSEKFGQQQELRVLQRVSKYIAQPRDGRRGRGLRQADAVRDARRRCSRSSSSCSETIDNNGIMGNFSYAGMPFDEAERNIKCFAKHVMPELKKWKTAPLPEPAELKLPSESARAA